VFTAADEASVTVGDGKMIPGTVDSDRGPFCRMFSNLIASLKESPCRREVEFDDAVVYLFIYLFFFRMRLNSSLITTTGPRIRRISKCLL
jgi:hypothetical protein